jgi:hypothetical protein
MGMFMSSPKNFGGLAKSIHGDESLMSKKGKLGVRMKNEL